MTTDTPITVLLPADTQMGTIKAMADDAGCTVVRCEDGTLRFVPKPLAAQPKDYAEAAP